MNKGRNLKNGWGASRWSAHEDSAVIAGAGKQTTAALAGRLGRSERAVRRRAVLLGVRLLRRDSTVRSKAVRKARSKQRARTMRKRWSDRDLQQLKVLIRKHDYDTVARMLGRTAAALKQAAYRFGMASDRPDQLRDSSVRLIERLGGYVPAQEIASKLGCSARTVRRYRERLGISYRRGLSPEVRRDLLRFVDRHGAGAAQERFGLSADLVRAYVRWLRAAQAEVDA